MHKTNQLQKARPYTFGDRIARYIAIYRAQMNQPSHIGNTWELVEKISLLNDLLKDYEQFTREQKENICLCGDESPGQTFVCNYCGRTHIPTRPEL